MVVYSKLNRPIVVIDYDPQWPILFGKEKERILAALDNRVVIIEHIGSTAIPGMAAKPVVDIAVGIRNFAESRAYIPLIEGMGYIYEPTLELLAPERRFFWKGTPTVHTYHLHLAEVDNPAIIKPIRFRDYLRQHPDTAGEYGRLKRKLAISCQQDMDAYVAGKTDFVEQVMRKAELEIMTSQTVGRRLPG